MDKIKVKVLQEATDALAMCSLAANITQHPITDMDDIDTLVDVYRRKPAKGTLKFCQEAGHNSITRHSIYTLAIFGASRRVLAQLRTHTVGMAWTSASLQYQDISNTADFVVPYKILKACDAAGNDGPKTDYLLSCRMANDSYRHMTDWYGNDTGGYVTNNAVRNLLVVSGNAEAFNNLIRRRTCNRNTDETAYVAFLIWQALLQTESKILFENAGSPCLYGACPEGKMHCSDALCSIVDPMLNAEATVNCILERKWPLLKEVK